MLHVGNRILKNIKSVDVDGVLHVCVWVSAGKSGFLPPTKSIPVNGLAISSIDCSKGLKPKYYRYYHATCYVRNVANIQEVKL